MTTEPCGNCVHAKLGPWHGFSANCLGCAARAVARGPNYRRCRDAGMQDRRYRAELEQFKLTHDQVREAAKVDQVESETSP
jgi:hypothetical protein